LDHLKNNFFVRGEEGTDFTQISGFTFAQVVDDGGCKRWKQKAEGPRGAQSFNRNHQEVPLERLLFSPPPTEDKRFRVGTGKTPKVQTASAEMSSPTIKQKKESVASAPSSMGWQKWEKIQKH